MKSTGRDAVERAPHGGQEGNEVNEGRELPENLIREDWLALANTPLARAALYLLQDDEFAAMMNDVIDAGPPAWPQIARFVRRIHA